MSHDLDKFAGKVANDQCVTRPDETGFVRIVNAYIVCLIPQASYIETEFLAVDDHIRRGNVVA